MPLWLWIALGVFGTVLWLGCGLAANLIHDKDMRVRPTRAERVMYLVAGPIAWFLISGLPRKPS